MASHHGTGAASGFAAAAKVLFDSAKKVGAVEPLDVTSKLYAHQLKKIQSQSRKKGGSLGSVSYKVAEFLATQRTPKVNIVRNNATIAKQVPLIDIPLQQPKKKAMTNLEKPQTKEVPTLDFVTRKPQQLDMKPVASKVAFTPVESMSAESLLTDNAIPSLDFVLGKKKGEDPSNPSASMTLITKERDATPPQSATVLSERKNVTIAEDKPLFESSNVTERKVSPLVDRDVRAMFEKPAQLPERPAKPFITVPISAGAGTTISSGISPVEPLRSEVVSVDVWELQRERELQQLREVQERAERERLTMQREEEHRTLGDEWVRSRTTTTPTRQMDETACILEKMYFTNQWEKCYDYFKQLMGTPTVSGPVSRQAVKLMERHLKHIPLERRDAVRSVLIKELKDRKLHDDVVKFELRQENGEAFLRSYRSAPSSVRDTLDFSTLSKAVPTLTRAGFWQEAIELICQSHTRFTDKTGKLELGLLTASRLLDAEAVKEVIEYVTKTLTASERFGRLHKLEILRMEKGSRRRHLISQLMGSNDVDEAVYAELLRITTKENANDVLGEVRKRGLNAEDPVILGIVCWKAFDPESPEAVFREIERQEAKTGIRPVHLMIAIAMARASKTEYSLRSAVCVLKKMPVFKAKFALRKLLPLLHAKKMNKEILELADLYGDSVPIAKALPRAVAFINNALLAEGRAPLSEQSVSDLQLQENVSHESVSPEATNATTTDVETMTELMLRCAKERDWVMALTLINSIPPQGVKGGDAETLTLLYNCALGASVDKVDLVKPLYARMVERGVQMNATTNNAVLSSLMRSSQWKEAIEFFAQTDISLRDTNTYSIMLTLFGKSGMWEEALDAFQTAVTRYTKAPPIIYVLGISAVQNHSWSATLSIFQTLQKAHGLQNIKDSVVDKVVHCLSQNRRTTELQRLESEMARIKKKKK